MLCSTCIETLQHAIDIYNPNGFVHDTPHHRTAQSFRSSLEQHCYLCTQLWNRLEAVRDWWPTFKTSWDKYHPSPEYGNSGFVVTSLSLRELNWRGQPQSKCYELCVSCYLPAQRWTSHSIRLCMESLDGSLTGGFPVSLEPTTASPNSLVLARRWLDDCVKNHERCNSRQEDTVWRPTRLLKIEQNEHLETSIRLIKTAETKPAGPYGTVTHRWGFTAEDKQRVILTQATYPKLSTGISLSSMPRLFQDIINIACQLGLRYIWIDAFCIFQDNDNSDWQRESSLMQKVYTNSSCNLSAADATSCSESLINARNPGLITFPVIELKCSHRNQPLAPASQQYLIYDPSFWKHEVTEALVNTRGWVLQERVLSPRVLHLGKRQVMWECCEHSAAETFPDGLHAQTLEAGRAVSKENDLFFATTRSYRDRKGEELDLYYLWTRLVEFYTACKLTFQSDKLIACSGLAKIIQARIEDEYVAGMWRKYLEHELLWQPEVPNPSQQKKSHLPSWTWASTDRPCRRDPVQYYGTLLYKVESVDLQYASDDPTGDILSGRLHLRGTLMPTQLIQSTHEQPELFWKVAIEGVELQGTARYTEHFVRASEPFRDGSPVGLNHNQESFEVENTEGKIFAMPAWTNTYGIGMQRSLMTILLFQLLDAENIVYERLGIFKQYDENCKLILAMREDANGERRKVRERVPCVEFSEGMHTFVVV